MHIINAHQNNLKNVTLSIPENKLIVVTGLSGSGKSSLAMGVIANEGYRYFLESLAAYSQQNALSISTAEVDDIIDLPPVVKVEQSKRFQSINATFGTLAELTPIFRILFARYSAEHTMSKSLFSFNHPKGACEVCRGIGEEEYIDLEKLIGDEDKTLREGAITTTLPNGYIVYSQITVEELDKVCHAHGFSVDIPWKELSAEQKDVVLNGSDRVQVFFGKHGLESRLKWSGIKAKPREEGYYKGMLPIMEDILRRDRNPNILKFASSRLCPSCKGGRIKAESLKFKWQSLNFREWMDLTLFQLYAKLESLNLTAGEATLVNKLKTPLNDLIQLGMGEYSLSTSSLKITSGDAQRIKLINQVNSRLQGILYVFDEPSIGLSKSYQNHLLYILNRLIRRGNTVMVVEHDLDFIRSADWLIELGPHAGNKGGEIIFNGAVKDFLNEKKIKSHTLNALHEEDNLRETSKLQSISSNDLKFQKASLIVASKKTLNLQNKIAQYSANENLNETTVTDQPIGKTARSNPSTYTGLADKIRDLLAKTSSAKELGLAKGAFSFNNKSGRCPNCEGAGVITLSMSVMGSVNQICPNCNGKRFKEEVLKVKWNHLNIADIYNLSVSEAYEFFSSEKKIVKILSLMMRLGLGYIKLGQPSNTLSGGEAQRIKLTKHFAKSAKNTLLILEEPSIGLHYHNVVQLLDALHILKKETAGILCYENHTLFQRSADVFVDNAVLANNETQRLETAQATDTIKVKGARTHHLKDLSLNFPKQKLSVVTGISGSGKSSLVIDTLHGYGLQEMTKQFSSYQQSRVGVNFQFEVDQIEGLTPSICISRKQKNYSQHSDISKQTGIDKILRFAFSRKAQYEGEELSASHFSNNHELGRCIVCEGTGQELIPDLDKMIPDESKNIAEGLLMHNKAIGYYGDPEGQHMAVWRVVAKENGLNLETPYQDYTQEQKKMLLYGTGEKVWKATWNYKTKTRSGKQNLHMKWEGLFNYLIDEYYKTRMNKNIAGLTSLLSHEKCSNCKGSGIKPERLDYQLNGKSIHEIKLLNFRELNEWLSIENNSNEIDAKLVGKMLPHLNKTIKRASQLHIDHLQLNRKSSTLSGGENQRVELIQQMNSPIKGITYLLDEPSAGLSNDNVKDLISILQELVQKGNTAIVIEHNKEILLSADHIVEIGPQAGKLGGYVRFEGSVQDLLKEEHTHTFLKSPSEKIHLRSGDQFISLRNVSRYSLKKEKLEVAIGGITALTGKSGIGKTTLVKDVLIPSIKNGHPHFCSNIVFPNKYDNAHYFTGKKLRSHLSTLLVDYLGVLQTVTQIFAENTKLKPKDFSYKTKSSQCPNCKGKGYLETSLDVAANAVEVCEKCKGKRYKEEILQHEIDAQNIADVLNYDLSELFRWLNKYGVSERKLLRIIEMQNIGLGHLTAEQTVQSLSSGEKQRLLLMLWLEDQPANELFILDEPSTGLHYADIDLLFDLLKRLSKKNDILVIEHNPYLLNKIGVGLELE